MAIGTRPGVSTPGFLKAFFKQFLVRHEARLFPQQGIFKMRKRSTISLSRALIQLYGTLYIRVIVIHDRPRRICVETCVPGYMALRTEMPLTYWRIYRRWEIGPLILHVEDRHNSMTHFFYQLKSKARA